MAVNVDPAAVLSCDIDQLVAAAIRISDHGEDLAAEHLRADNQLESAASGWTGRSAAALNNRADLWRRQSRELVSRVGEHATGLHSTAISFAAMVTEHAAALRLPEG